MADTQNVGKILLLLRSRPPQNVRRLLLWNPLPLGYLSNSSFDLRYAFSRFAAYVGDATERQLSGCAIARNTRFRGRAWLRWAQTV